MLYALLVLAAILLTAQATSKPTSKPTAAVKSYSWNEATLPSTNTYKRVWSDSTGNNLFLFGYNSSSNFALLRSTNFGSTWTSINVPTTTAFSVVATNGQYYAAVTGSSYDTIYLSSDHGVTWYKSGAASQTWTSVCIDATGLKLSAISGTAVYISSDGGNTWKYTHPNSQSITWTTMVCDSTGSRITLGYNNELYYSTDGAYTWTSTTDPKYTFGKLVSNQAGDVVTTLASIIINYSQYYTPYISIDYGVTWSNPQVNSYYWTSFASDESGKNLVTAQSYSSNYYGAAYTVYISNDYGATWTEPNELDVPRNGFTSVAINGDGTKVAALGNNLLYIATSA